MSVRTVMGKLLSLQVKAMSALKNIVRLPDDKMLDWLLSDDAEDAICEACATGWNSLVERWEKYQKEFCDFHSFLQTRPGLWVSDDFRTRVLAKAISDAQAVPIKSFILERNMTDLEIEQVFGDNHLFTEADLCATISKLIQEQWGGKEGELLNGGQANLFYNSSCVVLVRWHVVRVRWRVGHREWRVDTWDRDDDRWDAGHRVFSPATAA